MNEQLQSKLVEILSAIQAGTKAAGDFAMEQLPDIAQQYVTYGRTVNTVWVVLGVGIVVSCVWLLRKIPSLFRENDYGNDPEIMLRGFGGGIGCVVGTCMALEHISAAILVWSAPKVWLLKEIASLLK